MSLLPSGPLAPVELPQVTPLAIPTEPWKIADEWIKNISWYCFKPLWFKMDCCIAITDQKVPPYLEALWLCSLIDLNAHTHQSTMGAEGTIYGDTFMRLVIFYLKIWVLSGVHHISDKNLCCSCSASHVTGLQPWKKVVEFWVQLPFPKGVLKGIN